MIRQTIIPTANVFSIKIPDEWIGESITIEYGVDYSISIKLASNYLGKPSDLFADCRIV